MILHSWISPKTTNKLKSIIAGKGSYAIEEIQKDEVVAIKSGHIIDGQTLEANRALIKGAEAQITDNLYLAPLTKSEVDKSMIYINHSCDPNVGMGGNILLRAMRDIKKGEELTLDYAMHISSPLYKLDCACKSKYCRTNISGNDWKIPELQKKYDGYFSWYINEKIKSSS
jgi:hypothetical protein